jgi:pentatricopeptide repeat protein
MNLNIVVYNSVINGLCYEGCLIEVFRLFDSLEKLNLTTSEITYATLVYTLCREGYLQDVVHVFEKMVLHGFQPKRQVYNSVLDAISMQGQLEKAFELLNDMEYGERIMMLYQSEDSDSKYSSSLPSCCESGLDSGSYDTRYLRNHMTISRLHNFDL